MKTIILFLLTIAFISCSSSQETTKESNKNELGVDEVYVFDDVNESTKKAKKEEVKKLSEDIDKTIPNDKKSEAIEKTTDYNKPVTQNYSVHQYYLQLGAFSTLKRAENYIREINSSVPFPISVVYNNKNSLYTVRSSAFSTRAEVEKIRDGLWKANMFKDSFIVTE